MGDFKLNVLLSCLACHRNVSYFWWYLNQSTWNKLSLIRPGVLKWLFVFLHSRTLKNMFLLLNNQTMNFRDSLWLNGDTFTKKHKETKTWITINYSRVISAKHWFPLSLISTYLHTFIGWSRLIKQAVI